MAAPKVCALVSGGFDSAAMVVRFLERGYEVHPLFVRCGLRWERAELHWLRRILAALDSPRLEPLTIVDAAIPGLSMEHWSVRGRGVPAADSAWDSVYLPGRNLLLLTEAGIHAANHRISAIGLAILKGNPFLDARPRFLSLMSQALSAALGKRLSVLTPFARMGKGELPSRFPRVPIGLTFSCLSPRGLRPCERCSKCAERALLRSAPSGAKADRHA